MCKYTDHNLSFFAREALMQKLSNKELKELTEGDDADLGILASRILRIRASRDRYSRTSSHRLNYPIEEVLDDYVERRKGKLVEARRQLKKRFDGQEHSIQEQIMLAFMEHGSLSEREFIYEKLYGDEFWLRDKKGNRIINEETGKKMRPDFALHFPDDTDILIDSKVSLTALTDYFSAQTDEERAEASARNLESVENHIKELTSKEYQKYVVGRKTLDYVIMFIPNYAAYQLAKMEDKDIFAKAFKQNVLLTTEETLIPFLRLIRTAWVQKEQMENIEEIVKAAQNMVERVALFCEENTKLEDSLESFVEKFKKNSARLVDNKQSIVKAAWDAVNHGIKLPTVHALPGLEPSLLPEE